MPARLLYCDCSSGPDNAWPLTENPSSGSPGGGQFPTVQLKVRGTPHSVDVAVGVGVGVAVGVDVDVGLGVGVGVLVGFFDGFTVGAAAGELKACAENGATTQANEIKNAIASIQRRTLDSKELRIPRNHKRIRSRLINCREHNSV